MAGRLQLIDNPCCKALHNGTNANGKNPNAR
jgi:hypothetical protein